MIVPMKRVYIICPSAEREAAVAKVKGLGVLHVVHEQPPQGKALPVLQEEMQLAETGLDILRQYAVEKGAPVPEGAKPALPSEWKQKAHRLVELAKHKEQLIAYSRQVNVTLQEWLPWGDFSPEAVHALAANGVSVRLFQVPVSRLGEIPAGVAVEQVFQRAGIAYCAVVSRQPVELPFKEVPLPKHGIRAMRAKLAEDIRMMGKIDEEIRGLAPNRELFQARKEALGKEIEFQEAVSGMAQEGGLSYISGYVPADALLTLSQEAGRNQWGLASKDPAEDEDVPTLLRTPKWVTVINPLFRLLEVSPGYRELDVSVPFLVFFSIFFGIIIGDAGYGLTYFLLTVWMFRKKGKSVKDKTPFFLFFLLSSSAMVWGALTGVFFGQAWVAKLGFHGFLPRLNDPKVMQTFCFFLGAFHLSLAHVWRAILKMPALTFLMDVGWICVLWCAFFFAKMLILGDPLPGFVLPLLYSGIGLVVLFTNPQKNMLKAVGEGLGNVALSLMNNFTDVVSYVRLFAVGMAGLAIAETGNAMAAGLGSGWVALVAAPVIVVIGHALNIILGPVSVLVHGVRLNVLEFSGHAGISWSGRQYRPLKA